MFFFLLSLEDTDNYQKEQTLDANDLNVLLALCQWCWVMQEEAVTTSSITGSLFILKILSFQSNNFKFQITLRDHSNCPIQTSRYKLSVLSTG